MLVYDQRQATFFNGDDPVPSDKIRESVRYAVRTLSDRLHAMCQQAEDGKITAAQLSHACAAELAHAHHAAAAAAAGGEALFSSDGWKDLEKALDIAGRLADFKAMLSGDPFAATARAAAEVPVTFEKARRWVNLRDGAAFECRVAGPSCCAQCKEISRLGWKPAGELPGPGLYFNGHRCKCRRCECHFDAGPSLPFSPAPSEADIRSIAPAYGLDSDRACEILLDVVRWQEIPDIDTLKQILFMAKGIKEISGDPDGAAVLEAVGYRSFDGLAQAASYNGSDVRRPNQLLTWVSAHTGQVPLSVQSVVLQKTSYPTPDTVSAFCADYGLACPQVEDLDSCYRVRQFNPSEATGRPTLVTVAEDADLILVARRGTQAVFEGGSYKSDPKVSHWRTFCGQRMLIEGPEGSHSDDAKILTGSHKDKTFGQAMKDIGDQISLAGLEKKLGRKPTKEEAAEHLEKEALKGKKKEIEAHAKKISKGLAAASSKAIKEMGGVDLGMVTADKHGNVDIDATLKDLEKSSKRSLKRQVKGALKVLGNVVKKIKDEHLTKENIKEKATGAAKSIWHDAIGEKQSGPLILAAIDKFSPKVANKIRKAMQMSEDKLEKVYGKKGKMLVQKITETAASWSMGSYTGMVAKQCGVQAAAVATVAVASHAAQQAGGGLLKRLKSKLNDWKEELANVEHSADIDDLLNILDADVVRFGDDDDDDTPDDEKPFTEADLKSAALEYASNYIRSLTEAMNDHKDDIAESQYLMEQNPDWDDDDYADLFGEKAPAGFALFSDTAVFNFASPLPVTAVECAGSLMTPSKVVEFFADQGCDSEAGIDYLADSAGEPVPDGLHELNGHPAVFRDGLLVGGSASLARVLADEGHPITFAREDEPTSTTEDVEPGSKSETTAPVISFSKNGATLNADDPEAVIRLVMADPSTSPMAALLEKDGVPVFRTKLVPVIEGGNMKRDADGKVMFQEVLADEPRRDQAEFTDDDREAVKSALTVMPPFGESWRLPGSAKVAKFGTLAPESARLTGRQVTDLLVPDMVKKGLPFCIDVNALTAEEAGPLAFRLQRAGYEVRVDPEGGQLCKSLLYLPGVKAC
jgi:hypothetical protein